LFLAGTRALKSRGEFIALVKPAQGRDRALEGGHREGSGGGVGFTGCHLEPGVGRVRDLKIMIRIDAVKRY
jgi:hypothetical protein